MQQQTLAEMTREELALMLGKLSDRLSALETPPQAVALNQTPSPGSSEPAHPPGLCGEDSCAPCVESAQTIALNAVGMMQGELIQQGRLAGFADLQSALTWAGGAPLADKINGIARAWVSAGRPSPGGEPALFVVDDGAIEG
ncbi:MAG: hypothetical protein Q8R28_11305 [Dehalococcoidia bacterium]|nr:hypothetical protein [Dehalococcoidia bacterium]